VTRSVTKDPVWVAVRSVLICDARPGTGQAVARLAKSIPTAVDVAVVTDRFGLSAAFAVKPADLVLIGLSPDSPDGAAATDQLLTQHPSAHVIVYGSVHDSAALAAAVARGAHGFLLWTPDERNHQPSPPTGAPPRREPTRIELRAFPVRPTTDARPDPPTARELQVLQGMSRGQTNREIGRDLFLSTDTVKTHASRLFRRLGAHDRGHAVALAMRTGLVT
jgi:DNA-binding NarL/FixJ family response regulator